jgi:23S rRNA (uridine2552-2'-O)-methyltransferase
LSRSKSSDQWLREHFADPYVKKAQASGYRSRAAFKLLELDERDKFFNGANVVVDLGAAPGGWCQVARELVPKARVYALDILDIVPLDGVHFVQGDFTEDAALERLSESGLNLSSVDLILSDMAPNMSGIADVDIPRSLYLVELALDFAGQYLKQGGHLVAKVFQGQGFDALMRDMRRQFTKVVNRKPGASRPNSREFYVVCKGFRR